MKIKLIHYETKEVVEWTLEQVLEEINRDRSQNFTPYDETDWQEGLTLTDWSEYNEMRPMSK